MDRPADHVRMLPPKGPCAREPPGEGADRILAGAGHAADAHRPPAAQGWPSSGSHFLESRPYHGRLPVRGNPASFRTHRP